MAKIGRLIPADSAFLRSKHILLVVDEIFVHEKCLDKICSPQKPSIATFLVIKVIISYDNFIATDPMKKNLGHDLVFLIFTDKNLAGNKNLV